MNTSRFSPANFPLEFSRVVSEAAMHLPPLTRPQDTAFLQLITEDVMDIFWSNYVASLPLSTQNEYEKAELEETGEELIAWYKKYANFTENQEAEQLGSMILTDISIKLPAAMKSEYDSFTLTESAQS